MFIIFNISLIIWAQNDQMINKAINFVRALEVENYSEATTHFDAKMKEVFPSEKLVVTWKTVVSQAGAFKQIVNTQVDKNQPYTKVVITCEFENLLGDINIFFDDTDKIAGFNVVPSQAALGHRPQEPKKPYPYKEQEVVYKNEKADITITGTLTLPETKMQLL